MKCGLNEVARSAARRARMCITASIDVREKEKLEAFIRRDRTMRSIPVDLVIANAGISATFTIRW
jgi:NADP-dependent 3-hydroxy acid dehydrogenase YdfG